MGIRDQPTSYRSPWQNGHSERLIGSVRRECTDHLIAFNADHLRRLLVSYATYYNEMRTHVSFGKDAPRTRGSGEMAKLYGDFDKPGPYLVLMRWNPGWFSAPHSYATDRIQMVMSGTWWVNSGADFTPKMAVPVPAGGFVKRTARTFHYDGVPSGIKDPVVVAVFGVGPVDIELADPMLPAWRQV
jgi:Integrase core domain